jgi:hypothetical protein
MVRVSALGLLVVLGMGLAAAAAAGIIEVLGHGSGCAHGQVVKVPDGRRPPQTDIVGRFRRRTLGSYDHSTTLRTTGSPHQVGTPVALPAKYVPHHSWHTTC